MESDNDYPSFSSCFTCYLCGELFRRPRILPCGHTFCSECLAKLRDEIIKDGRPEQEDLISDSTIGYSSSVSTSPGKTKTLTPEYNNFPEDESLLRNHDICNGDTKESTSVRKTSSSCVDDVDNMAHSLSYPPPSMAGQWSMSSSSTSPAISKNQSSTSDAKRATRETTPTNKPRKPKERSPTMTYNAPASFTKSCAQCGSIVPSKRDSMSSLSRSSIYPNRDQSQLSSSNTNSKENQPRWDTSSPNKSPNRKSGSFLQPPACSFEQKHGREMEQFVCPIPQCNYSMRVMNLARWSPKNKTVANALAVWRRQTSQMQDSSTQTNISNSQSVLVTIPRSIVDSSPSSSMVPLGRKRHSSMIDIAIDQATVSMDGLPQPRYIPRGHYTWKSYAAMVGMNILQQILNL